MAWKLCYPHPLGASSHVSTGWHAPLLPNPGAELSTGLHETGGLPGNWALDFLAPAGTLVLAVEAGTITRLSGHDPKAGVFPGRVFGWNTYLTTPDELVYFYTHQGRRFVDVDQKVRRGEAIGIVGAPPSSFEWTQHTHLGVTFPAPPHPRSSQRAIVNVGLAPRVKVPA